VAYFGVDIPTCLAEVFQSTRHVSTSRNHLQLTAFAPRRPLELLDLRGTWPVTAGASHAINSGPKNRCRAWAHALRGAYPHIDGLLFTGMAGRDSVTVYSAAPHEVFPDRPSFTRPLSDPALTSRIADACAQIRYALD